MSSEDPSPPFEGESEGAPEPEKGEEAAQRAKRAIRPALLVHLKRPLDFIANVTKNSTWGLFLAFFASIQLERSLIPGLDVLRGIVVASLILGVLISLGFLSIEKLSIEVGVDGLIIRYVLRRRLIPFSQIERVELRGMEGLSSLWGPRVVLHLRGGGTASIALKRLGSDKAMILYKRIERARRAHARAAGKEDVAALTALARRGQTVADWQAEASRKLRSAADYRSAQVTQEEVEWALESPTASAERRLGAAMALVGSGDPEARERVRVCAQALVEPKLRVALSTIAEGEVDAEAVEEALQAEQKRSL